MELDELKSLWQNQQLVGKAHSEQDIQAILKQKTNPILKRIYDKFFLEMGISSVIVAFITGVYIYQQDYALAMMSILVSGLIGSVYWLIYKQVNINFSLDSLKVALSKMERLFNIYDKLLKYVRYMLGIGFCIGITIGYFINKKPFEFNLKFFVLLTTIVPVSIVLSYPMKWLIDYMYGQHIQELKGAYLELNDLEK
ncbi:hypothetical protein [Microscilla marina]|uniref:Uncharacterized protein n=1 Tax=Microscilla marina ATCC 23134 TaxID=313606 RepID=A1ZGK9_MICM2|nr:hypothetical protein [Microscilla marina]EAY30626.1 hypothetical protein M23134_03264 [Microscilla marina ATCC 23134]